MKRSEKLGFAVVGIGSIAKMRVLPAFRHAKRAKLVALVSRDKAKAKKVARSFGNPEAYSAEEYASCLANPAVDAVYIATPNSEHYQATIRAAQAGKHVLCEKPLAATLAQSEEMVHACEMHGVQLMTAYRKYFEPSTVYFKQLIKTGQLGKIDQITAAFSELHVPGKSLAWLLDAELAGGGPLMDLGVYCVNTSRWLLGEVPMVVSARSWKNDASRFQTVEEGISFCMEFSNGAKVHGSTTYGSVLSSFLFVQGTKGWASLSPAFPFDEERRLTGKIKGKWFEKKFPIIDEFAPQLDAFAKAVASGKPVEPDGRQGHLDMAILTSIYDSAKRGHPVIIKY